jgi:Mycothiol maleylpyruvate isomerase N-terminal domain
LRHSTHVRIDDGRRAGGYCPGMDYLAQMGREFAAFEACLGGDLAAPVEHCGDWTLYDLADHLGGGNLWAAAGVTEQRGDYEAPPAPRDPAALRAWFNGTCGELLTAPRCAGTATGRGPAGCSAARSCPDPGPARPGR